MPAHIHAESMIQYGHDALTTDKPWELWEYQQLTKSDPSWYACEKQPGWSIHCKYRHKQKTININSFEVPEPVRAPLEVGTVYYVFIPIKSNVSCSMVWANDEIDRLLLKRGLIHLTPEAAELHAKALLSFTSSQVED